MAQFKSIEGATRRLGAPEGWTEETEIPCGVLPIRDIQIDGVNFMISAWELSADELAALANGETLKLWIQGVGHPVVAITVGDVA